MDKNWISINDRFPEKDIRVLIVRDVRKWDKNRKPYIDIANTHYTDKEILIGGPNSLTGYKRIKGLYFSVPAILHPESITYWMYLPNHPDCD